jgi:hypothetical protein
MKIINNTNGTLQYVVTPSGTILKDSPIVASGTIPGNTAREFDASKAVTAANVYFKLDSQYAPGYAMRQSANPNSVLKIEITEE